MTTYNICFHGEERKISVFFGPKSVLPGAMHIDKSLLLNCQLCNYLS